MADPLSPAIMLATSMHAQPGMYALLLGSDVSTGVPAGWQITTGLARQIAVQEGPEAAGRPGFDVENWWHERSDLSHARATVITLHDDYEGPDAMRDGHPHRLPSSLAAVDAANTPVVVSGPCVRPGPL